MPAQLVALNDGPTILIDKPILLLGRHPECDIQIDSRKISRRHCCIAQVNDYLVIRDLDSTNGIRINGIRVLEGKLNSGDEVTIGNHRYQVAWEETPGRPMPQPKSAKPGSGRGKPSRPVDDDDLEECDEPVALPDPGRSVPVPQVKPPLGKQLKDDDSFVLPENLQLLPNSEAFPKQG